MNKSTNADILLSDLRSNKGECVICGSERFLVCSSRCEKKFRSLYLHPISTKQAKRNKKLILDFTKRFTQAVESLANYISQHMSNNKEVLNQIKHDNALSTVQKFAVEDTKAPVLRQTNAAYMALALEQPKRDPFLIAQAFLTVVLFKNVDFYSKIYDLPYDYMSKLDKQNFRSFDQMVHHFSFIYNRTYKMEHVRRLLAADTPPSFYQISENAVWLLLESSNDKARADKIHRYFAECLLHFEEHEKINHTSLIKAGLDHSSERISVERGLHDLSGLALPYPSDVALQIAMKSSESQDELLWLRKEYATQLEKLRGLERTDSRQKRAIHRLEAKLSETKGAERAQLEAKKLRDDKERLQKQLTDKNTELTKLRGKFKQLKEEQAQVSAAVLTAHEVSPADTPAQFTPLFVKGAADLLDHAQQIYKNRLDITKQAYASAREVRLSQSAIEKGWAALEALGEYLWTRRFTDQELIDEARFKADTGLDYAKTESRGVKNDGKMMAQRRIQHNGKEYLITRHVKIGKRTPDLLRVHFAIDEESKKIVIGHFGGHLTTLSTAKTLN